MSILDVFRGVFYTAVSTFVPGPLQPSLYRHLPLQGMSAEMPILPPLETMLARSEAQAQKLAFAPELVLQPPREKVAYNVACRFSGISGCLEGFVAAYLLITTKAGGPGPLFNPSSTDTLQFLLGAVMMFDVGARIYWGNPIARPSCPGEGLVLLGRGAAQKLNERFNRLPHENTKGV